MAEGWKVAVETYGHYYYRTPQPPLVPRTCTSRTRSPHKTRRSDFEAGWGSSCSSGRMLGYDTSLEEGRSESRRV